MLIGISPYRKLGLGTTNLTGGYVSVLYRELEAVRSWWVTQRLDTPGGV